MKTEVPYNAGEYRKTRDHGQCIIMGHIWWPVEQTNAYHVMKVDEYGEPTGNPIYEWDYTHGKWPVFEPQQKAA